MSVKMNRTKDWQKLPLPETKFKLGISETINWYKKNLSKII